MGNCTSLVFPQRASSAPGGKQQPRRAPSAAAAPSVSGADRLPPQQCPACSHSLPPLVPQNREPSRAPESGLVPQLNLGQTHSWLPLHQPTLFCPCKLPLLHTALTLILILPLGNFHFSSHLWMPTNSLSILMVCSKHPYSGYIPSIVPKLVGEWKGLICQRKRHRGDAPW